MRYASVGRHGRFRGRIVVRLVRAALHNRLPPESVTALAEAGVIKYLIHISDEGSQSAQGGFDHAGRIGPEAVAGRYS